MTAQPLRITLLVDNEAGKDLLAEHGFAAWIEVGGHCILFDTGQGTALVPNSSTLGIDLARADALVLSHGHYDHTGGIPDFLARNAAAPVYSGSGFDVARYSCHPDKPPRSIGLDEPVRALLRALPERRRVVLEAPRYLMPGVGISGPIPRLTAFEDTGGPFFLDTHQNEPDGLNDDLSIWFETTQGLLILTGCCHSGLVNTIRYIRRISGIDRVSGIIGGLHLLQAGEERLQQTMDFLGDCTPDLLVPCHCTGEAALRRIFDTFGSDRVHSGGAGHHFAFLLSPE